MKCLRFFNADEIAKGLSPFDPSAAAVQAARILLTEIKQCLRRKETFALESTLSGKTYIRLIREAKEKGYEIELNYLWLSSSNQAIARVGQRVLLGGHHVPASDIRRRFKRSLSHLIHSYIRLADRWIFWDARSLPAKQLSISGAHDIKYVSTLIGL